MALRTNVDGERIGVGMPAFLKLLQFGEVISDAFGSTAYLVGSATKTRAWRDVDVRVILDDSEFERQIGELTRPRCMNERWNAFCLAFAALGRDMTGLPIDFQIDQRTAANEEYGGENRSALFVLWSNALASEAEGLRAALDAIRRNAESWHGDDVARARALAVIASWAANPGEIPEAVLRTGDSDAGTFASSQEAS